MKTSFARHARSFVLVTTFALAGCAVEERSEEAELTAQAESSIVGGTTTSAYPAVGALTAFGSPFCTGTVIAPRVVLTAAHCLVEVGASSMRFALGPNAFSPTVSIRVSRATRHPQYDDRQLTNDIGVVVLSQDAPVTPIPINTTAMDASWVGVPLTFVGYGATNGRTGAGSGLKREVAIPIAQVGATQFAYTGAKNTCFGDSGGPALWTTPSGGRVVAGVTSYGDQVCRQFGVDTRVDVYRSFIEAASR